MRILCVHAHPDDESSKGAGTIARYADAGAVATLVCCTGGEEGDILNPAMDRPEIRNRLAEVRLEELAKAAEIIGYRNVLMLGYRDSGMKDSEANSHLDSFAAAPLDEAVGRLVKILRTERPHVVTAYADQEGYDHPDHVRVHEISVEAFDAAGDPDAYPEAGEPWQPLKLYYSAWSRERILALHNKFLELSLKSPYEEWWFERPSQDHRITTKVDVGDWHDRRWDALLAHATQVDPESPFWFGLPRAVARDAYPWEDFILAKSHVETTLPEEDLFAGIELDDAGFEAPSEAAVLQA